MPHTASEDLWRPETEMAWLVCVSVVTALIVAPHDLLEVLEHLSIDLFYFYRLRDTNMLYFPRRSGGIAKEQIR